MSYIKTIYKLNLKQHYEDVVENLIYKEHFFFHRVLPIPDELYFKVSKEVVDWCFILNEVCLDEAISTLSELDAVKISDIDLDNNYFDDIVDVDALLNNIEDKDIPIFDHLNNISVDIALDVSRAMQCKLESGYFNYEDFAILNYGCLPYTYDHKYSLDDEHNVLTGEFFTSMASPLEFFYALKKSYPDIDIDLVIIDTENESVDKISI